MRKIPTIYRRDPVSNLRYVRNEPHPDCDWVFVGEGEPTFKYDGTCCMVDDDRLLWRRREVKSGADAPADWVQAGPADPSTGKRVGWVPCDRDNFADRWHWEGYDGWDVFERPGPGTYELIGPKVNGNPHQELKHMLRPHGVPPLHGIGGWFGRFGEPPTEFGALADWLRGIDYPGFEGIVWHHYDGRMAKIKAKDFPT